MKIVLALTGASGAVYGVRVLRALADRDVHVDLTVSERAVEVIRHELRLDLTLNRFELADLLEPIRRVSSRAASSAKTAVVGATADSSDGFLGAASTTVTFYHPRDLFAPPASGSASYDAMAIVPCSMGTIGRIAAGAADDLITRAADVFLKERRKLILAPRETPLSQIHLENLARLSTAGALVLPCMPSFYGHPKTVDDLVDTVAGRILDHLDVEHDLGPRWGEGD